MAWDDSYFCGYQIISGDKPVDELSMALRKITVEYTERFSRKPSVAELLYAFKIVIQSLGEDLLSDPENLNSMVIELIGRNDDS
ncbi:hypothetical protein ACJJIW_11205 [Microbulbifer sp. JMSA004]|uniref:hypothetical protein n=1 Tax=unclassified Microbulbifer TaxID=2619833 RepID=UPI0024AC9BA9|nr:hypothetical protein [Microbulbifer sp. VAAF005]WHI45854.1 hypothetical protein P0078_19360 [Microbulbifer sp. VAAF005]